MKKSATLFFLCILFTPLAFSQSGITGTITDDKGSPLPAANLLLLHQRDSTLIKGAIANEKGEYAFADAPEGILMIQSSMVGYQTRYSQPFQFTNGATIVVETLALAEDTQVLGEVEVVAKKPLFEQEIDKMTVNVQSSITAAGGTVLEILQRSPGVVVNQQNQTINISGKQGVMVMFNGKEMRLPATAIVQMLQGMSASDIEKIEIITNPSAKFEAQGDAGIINIVTKKNPDLGTNGTLALMAGYGLRWKHSEDISVNHRTQKFSLYADVSNFRNYTRQEFDNERTIGDMHTTTESDREPEMLVQRATLQADYMVTAQTTLGGTLAGFRDNWDMEANNTSITETPTAAFSTIRLVNLETNNWSHWMANANLTHRFSDQASIKLDADYLYYYDNNPHFYTNNYYYHEHDSSHENHVSISKKTPINMVVLRADYERMFKKVKLEAGAKAVMTSLSNDVSVQNESEGAWTEDGLLSQQYQMKDEVKAFYAMLSLPISNKIDAQLGMRAEQTYMNIKDRDGAEVFNLDFWSLFPTGFVSVKLTEKQKLNFSAGRRITRPSYEDIAPFVIFLDPFTYFSGNPQLKPTFTNNFSVAYSLKQLMITLKYSEDKNSIANFQSRVDEETRQTILYSVNLDKLKTYNLNVSFPLDFTPWWTSQTNLQGTYQTLSTIYDNSPVSMTQYSANLNTTHTFKLPKGFSAEFIGFYNAPSMFGIYKMNDFGSITVGVQKDLPKKAGKLNLSYQDIFWNNYWVVYADNAALNLDQKTTLRFESRVLRLTYTWNFGSNTVKSSQKSTASDEEKYRMKN